MKTISTLFFCALFSMTFAFSALAQNATQYEAMSADKTPAYKAGQKMYKIDRIEYTENHTIVHFVFNCDNNVYSGATYYGPNGPAQEAWFLKDRGTDATFPLVAIKNVQVDGQQVINEVMSTETFWSDYSAKKTKFTCEVYFDRLPAHVTTVDLIEGVGYEGRKNRFNCYNIKLKTPTFVTEPITEVLATTTETETIEETTTVTENTNASVVSTIQISSWTAYPNPARTYVNIELDDVQNAQVEVFGLNGQLVLQQETQDKINTIDVSQLAAGTYSIRVTTASGSSAQNVVVVK